MWVCVCVRCDGKSADNTAVFERVSLWRARARAHTPHRCRPTCTIIYCFVYAIRINEMKWKKNHTRTDPTAAARHFCLHTDRSLLSVEYMQTNLQRKQDGTYSLSSFSHISLLGYVSAATDDNDEDNGNGDEPTGFSCIWTLVVNKTCSTLHERHPVQNWSVGWNALFLSCLTYCVCG